MRALNKKVMTLACATCLTVGMGAVAYGRFRLWYVWQYVSYGESCRGHACSYRCKAT